MNVENLGHSLVSRMHKKVAIYVVIKRDAKSSRGGGLRLVLYQCNSTSKGLGEHLPVRSQRLLMSTMGKVIGVQGMLSS